MAKLLTFLTLLLPALAAPTFRNNDHKVKRAAKNAIDGQFIVKVRDGVSRSTSLALVSEAVSAASAGDGTSAEVLYSKWSVLHAYTAKLSGAALEAAKNDPNVEWIEEDSTMQIFFEPSKNSPKTKTRRSKKLNKKSKLAKKQAGASKLGEGVTIYSVDTGVFAAHECFGGRAVQKAVFGGGPNVDQNGHGTHTASTAACDGFGTATAAKVVGFRVLDAQGAGQLSDIIAGVNAAVEDAIATPGPSVINLSLGGGASTAVDAAIQNAVDNGIIVTIAAGNENQDANNVSPARVAAAITVGSVNNQGTKSQFSNFGNKIDVWFAGENILGAAPGAADATATLSGTSMAAPGVAGLIAVALSDNQFTSVQEVVAGLLKAAEPVVNVAQTASTNLLAQPF